MSIPESCSVLVVGGGPAGSYAAAALAREGVDVVVLEADHFPRYHIGESMLASIRHFLRFIDLENTFDAHGFYRKNGAAFKLNNKRAGYTDFLAANGPNGYSWNVIRSESDKLMFDHATKSGARTFQGVKVEALDFAPVVETSEDANVANPGRITSASWLRKEDGARGTILLDYIIDASGRNGIISTQYLKNRSFNQALKNQANWAYWKEAKTYAPGTPQEGSPLFEALTDQSGWCWSIPLHDGTMSVGIVMRQDLALERKRALGSPGMKEFYQDCLTLSPEINERLVDAELVTNIKAASDWSYSAAAYAGLNFRIVGDAGCFIDPYFSSGVHLALSSALSAAVTVQAVRNGEVSELEGLKWHSAKTAEGYSRFLLVVMTALKQIRKGEEPVLSDFDEDGFDRAFAFFRPIIQGHADADVSGKLTQTLVSKTVDFCFNAFVEVSPDARQAVLNKLESVKADPNVESNEDLEKLTDNELAILRTIRARQMMRSEDAMNIDTFKADVVEGFVPRLETGKLGLVKAQVLVRVAAFGQSMYIIKERRSRRGHRLVTRHRCVRKEDEGCVSMRECRFASVNSSVLAAAGLDLKVPVLGSGVGSGEVLENLVHDAIGNARLWPKNGGLGVKARCSADVRVPIMSAIVHEKGAVGLASDEGPERSALGITQKKPSSSARIAELESKVSGLISQLQSRNVIAGSETPAQSPGLVHFERSSSDGIAEQPPDGDEEDDVAESDQLEDDDDDVVDYDNDGIQIHQTSSRRSGTPKTMTTPEQISPRQRASEADADTLVSIFRTRMLPHFAFVELPAHLTARKLQRDRPFLFRAIVCVTSPSAKEKVAQGKALKRAICEAMIESEVRSSIERMDLLLALLTYISWGWDHVLNHCNPSQLMTQAKSLACGMRLDDTSHTEEVGLMALFSPDFNSSRVDQGQTVTAQDFLERQRAILGCFVLSSIVSAHYGHVDDALRWTRQMEDGLAAISTNRDCQTDAVFTIQVRSQLLAQKAVQLHQQQQLEQGQVAATDMTVLPALMGLMTLQQQLQDLQLSIVPSLPQQGIILAHIHSTELSITEITYAVKSMVPIMVSQFARITGTAAMMDSGGDTASNPSARQERSKCLSQCLSAVQVCTSSLLASPPSAFQGISFVQWAQLARCIAVLHRLTETIDDAAWDRAAGRAILNVPLMLGRMANKLELTAREIGEQGRDETFTQLARGMREFCSDTSGSVAHQHKAAQPQPGSRSDAEDAWPPPYAYSNYQNISTMGSFNDNNELASEPIAIIGLSCKFAGDADSPEKLWKMLAEGRNAWSEIPSTRFNAKAVYHPDSGKLSTMHVKGAHFLEEDVGLFDAPFFNYSAETASALDPQYRIQLESTYEALENAGLPMSQVAGSNTSVYAGIFTHDYHEGLIRDEEKLPRFLPIGTLSAMASNRISHFFDLKGPSMTVDTGCSTALVALHQAVLGLRTGEADMSIVTGCNLMLSADLFKVFSSLGMLGPDGRSYAFDSRANGYGRGEGVGTVVVKRLKDALEAGDPIRAVIRGTCLNQDGKTETITSPSQEAQEALIRECYRRAGLDPQDTQYFEAHGTGTPTGDPIEARAIAAVFGSDRADKLRIGSVKTNIGHTEAASGLAGLIKVVLALEKGLIPPSVNYEKPNPKLKLDEWGLKVATELEPWPATTSAQAPRRASVNNFGYGGTNSHVILEDAGTWTTPTPIQMDLGFHVGDRSEILLFYGRDEQACKRMVFETKEYLRRRKLRDPGMGAKGVVKLMKNLCWTLSKHRTRFPWVSAHAARYSDDLDQVIRGLDAPLFRPVRIPSRPPRIGMVFTGQGAQWHAMGRELINAFPIFRSTLFAADCCLRGLGANWSLMEELSRDAATTRVNDTGLSIPICVAVQIALVRLLRFWGISPTSVTSHSSGEISAAYTVGALTLRQAMAVAYYRAAMAADKSLMANGSGPKGAMVAVGVGSGAAQAYLDRTTSASGKAVLACINSPNSVTIAGDEAAVEEVEELAVADGVFARRLRVDTGYHSHHMKPIADPYRQALRAALQIKDEHDEGNRLADEEVPGGVHWAEAYESALLDAFEAEAQTLSTQGSIAFSSPVTGGRIARIGRLTDPEHWVGSLLQPVQFVDAFTDMVLGDMDESGTSVDVILEVGPHTALGGPIKEMLAEPEFEGVDATYMSCLVRNEDPRDTARAAALNLLRKGLPINQANISFPWGIWPFDPRVLTDLPSYPWNHSIRHWSEARVNQAYRLRDQEPNELLGALMPGTSPEASCWRQVVRLSENSWLRDHVIQGNVLYPGAGFVCLAIEGIKQLTDTDLGSSDAAADILGYRLREVEFTHALVIPDNAEGVDVHTVLRPVDDKAIGTRGWKHFEISSVAATSQWTQHAKGLINVEFDVALSPAPPEVTGFLTESGYTRRVDPEDMFANLRTKGLNHGPMFRNTTSIVQDGRSKEARCVTTIEVAELGRKHVIHPTTLDSVFIASYAALLGANASDGSPKVPRSLEKLWVSSRMTTTAGHSFTCNTKLPRQDARSYEADVCVVDGNEVVLDLQGFEGQSLGSSAADAQDENKQPWLKELCAEVEWAPDLALSLGLPGALPAVKKKLSPAKEMDAADREVLMGLRRVVVYFCHDALQTLTEKDVACLEPHHVKFYAWMQSTLELAASRRLCPDSDTWASDQPRQRKQNIAQAATQSTDGELICHLGPLLVTLLRGERAPLEAMMEGRLLYKYYANAFRMGPAFAQFTALLHAVAHKNPRARVLEIGAGTGAATRHALTPLDTEKAVGPPCETWHFTDISSGFFEAARAEFSAWGNLLEFDRLDIEQSPESQGFDLASYDIVVACQVLHATKSMARTMDHVHRLMKPGATLLLMETTQDQVDLQFIFGLLPGWWLSEEPERKSSPSLSVPLWDKVLKAAGFSGIDIELRDCETDDDMYSISNMLSTAPAVSFKLASDSIVIVINRNVPPPADWLLSLRESIAKVTGGGLPTVQALQTPSLTPESYSTKICLFVGEMDQPVLQTMDAAGLRGIKMMATGCKGLLWVTRGAAVECAKPNLALATGFLRVLRSEYVGRRFPTLDLDPNTSVWSEPGITAIVHVLQACLGTPDDVYSITAEAESVESEFAVRDGLILVPRVSKDVARNKMLTHEAPDWAVPESIPEAPLFQDDRPLRLEVGIPGLLDTLAFSDDKEGELSDEQAADMVEIEPRAYGLNFRDVMVAMGQLRERVMGLECAGIITRVGSEAAAQGFAPGDRVMALLLGPFGSRARVSWHGVAHINEQISFENAASLPMIFSTAYVALVDVAHLREGQSVLIHAAAGGVGQAAIMLAKNYLGAEVYVTVGSQEKRDLLALAYDIPPERIFNSRDASFAPAILAATGGCGVDVVLNSLAGPLLQAGFDVLAPFGHFVEIGKRDLEGNSLLEMATFSRVASFTSLDMMSLLRERGPHAHRVLCEVGRLAGQNIISPIHPVTVFPMQQVARAFRLLQTGKHTGKVVLSVSPDEQVRVLPRAATAKLRPDASYLLVGGVGGLGRSIAHWMVGRGARNLILLSRNADKQDSGAFVTQLRETGCRVVAISCDVASSDDLTRALNRCEREERLPPVRGVIQGAMVLQDSILEQMTLDDWHTAIRPKVAGSWNLHSRFSHPGSLDFFVMLSSLSCILGWASQTNYAAGGSYQDALARYRHATGLPAVSIDIGIVKGVGYVAESRIVSDRMRKAAQSLMLPDDAVLRAIAAAVLHPLDQPQVLLGLNSGPGPQWDPASESQMGRDARFVPLKYRRPPSAPGAGQQLGDGAMAKPLSAQLQEAGSHADATRLVGDAIAAKLSHIFMLSTDDIDLAKPPALYGVDSLVAVELRNMLMLQAASDVSIFSILQSASLAALASDVVAKSAHVAI
ncbi:hypothetical protein diail_8351, partial [Diaporthe ilicicola]